MQFFFQNIENVEGPDKMVNVATNGKSVGASIQQFPRSVNHPQYRDDHPTAAGFHDKIQHQNLINSTSKKSQNISPVPAQCLAKGIGQSSNRITLVR